MKDIEHERIVIRQYLLGELDEVKQEQLEQRVITDPEYKEEVLITEEELLEEFVNKTLSPRELELFTKAYTASPGRLRKVKIAQALTKHASKRVPLVQPVDSRSKSLPLIELSSANRRFHYFSVAALIIVVVGGSILAYWLISQEWRADYDTLLALNQSGSEILQPDDSVVSVALPPLTFRGTDERRNIPLTKQTRTVQLRLPDPTGGKSLFRVTLKNSDGTEVFTLEDLRARQIDQHSVLVLQIPANMLTPPHDFQLEIFEKSADGSYERVGTYPLYVVESP